MSRSIKRKAFTLVELLTCIAVVGILAAIIIVQMPGLRLRSESITTISNMRQIVTALNLYANDHGGQYPPSQNTSGSDKETWRQRVLYWEGYMPDVEVFNNPTNRRLRDGAGLGGGNIFEVGANKNTSFSSKGIVKQGWGKGKAVDSPASINSDLDVPILWDHRADILWVGNKMTTYDGIPGGHFAYADGEVRLIGPPSNVIRGQPDVQ